MSFRTGWRTQLVMRPELKDVSCWPDPDISGLSDTAQIEYYKRLNVVNRVLIGASVKEEAANARWTVQWVYELLNRALGCTEEEGPWLKAGLLPHFRLKSYKRSKACGSSSYGLSGAFENLLLKYPSVTKKLDEHIRLEAKGDSATPHMTLKGLRTFFSKLLGDAGCKATEYPFTTTGQGREALRRYRLHKRLEYLSNHRSNSANKNSLFSDQLIEVMDEWQFDSHLQDFESSLLVDTGGAANWIRVNRFWILLVAESRSTAVWGYVHGYSKKVTQDDVLACMASATRPWTPYKDLPQGLAYSTDGGFPSDIPALRYSVPAIFKFDNDWAHYSSDTLAWLHKSWCSILNWGRPKFPIARRIVEMVFRRLTTYEHQHPATTGNNPFDLRRDQHRDRAPRVPVTDIPKIVDVIIAEYNATPRPDLLNRSPLGVLRDAFGHAPA